MGGVILFYVVVDYGNEWMVDCFFVVGVNFDVVDDVCNIGFNF